MSSFTKPLLRLAIYLRRFYSRKISGPDHISITYLLNS